MISKTPTTIAQYNGWRLIDGIPGWEFPVVQVQLPDESWVWPDCVYSCELCDVCIGCARKIVHGHMQEWAESGDDTATLEAEMDCASLYGGRCSGSEDGRHRVRIPNYEPPLTDRTPE